jgi:2-dehydropantoate 2-reductase
MKQQYVLGGIVMIKTAAVLGAGAIGGYFIWGLSEKLGENLWVVASGERKAKLESEGVNINGKNYSLNVMTPSEAKGVDLLFVAAKYTSLTDSLSDIEKIVGQNTVVLSLLNGVDSEEIIGGRIGENHMLYSFIRISSERDGKNIKFNGDAAPGVFFGEKDGKQSARTAELSELFDGTPVHYHVCEDIIEQMWDKFALNISNNLPQAILNCGVGAYTDSIYAERLCQLLRDEVVAVAAAKGIKVSRKLDGSVAKGIVTRSARYSTLQDLDAKRRTEIDMFSGKVVKMGRELNVPTPCNEFVYNIIKALEEKNDGKFDY